MKYYFHPEAENELNASATYYENLQKGLGLKFVNEIYKTIQRIINFPTAWSQIDKDIRRCLVNRFPYGIIYYQKEDKIIILAIMHLQKKPRYWKQIGITYHWLLVKMLETISK